MSHTISPQHPAVVLRSTYRHLRVLLAIAMIAVVGLSAAVVILANDDASTDPLSSLTPTERQAVTAFGSMSQAQFDAALETAGSIRYDGGPEEGTRGPSFKEPTAEDALRLRSEELNRINGLD